MGIGILEFCDNDDGDDDKQQVRTVLDSEFQYSNRFLFEMFSRASRRKQQKARFKILEYSSQQESNPYRFSKDKENKD